MIEVECIDIYWKKAPGNTYSASGAPQSSQVHSKTAATGTSISSGGNTEVSDKNDSKSYIWSAYILELFEHSNLVWGTIIACLPQGTISFSLFVTSNRNSIIISIPEMGTSFFVEVVKENVEKFIIYKKCNLANKIATTVAYCVEAMIKLSLFSVRDSQYLRNIAYFEDGEVKSLEKAMAAILNKYKG